MASVLAFLALVTLALKLWVERKNNGLNPTANKPA
jgi:ABC-type sulfate transport system permease subunit